MNPQRGRKSTVSGFQRFGLFSQYEFTALEYFDFGDITSLWQVCLRALNSNCRKFVVKLNMITGGDRPTVFKVVAL